MRRNCNKIVKTETTVKLTADDYDRLNSIKLSYEKGFEVRAKKRDVSVFRHVGDRRSALLHMLADMYDVNLRLIKFIRNIPEFALLNENDRFILVQNNSPQVLCMYLSLNYDIDRGFVIDTSIEGQEYAFIADQWRRHHLGEQLYSQLHKMFRSIKEITNSDPIILQVIMVILLFAKSILLEDAAINEHLFFQNDKQIFQTQSIYIDLLFRYMVQKFSTYDQAVRQYAQIIHKIVQLITINWNYRQILEKELINIEIDELNPILKSILRFN